MSELSAAEKYRLQQADRPEEIVEVTVPSGFVFKFAKPSKFGMLFRYGKMPQTAANGAVQSWIDQGLLKPGEIAEDQAKQIDEGIKLRDRVLELSREPKLVVGDAANANEMSTDVLTDEDAEYLFAWIAAGGDVSAMTRNFPKRPVTNALAGTGRKKQRHAAK